MSGSFFDNEPREQPTGDVPPLNEGDNAGAGDNDSFGTEEGRLAAVMAYIPFLCFIPLMNMKQNKEARFHARQGVMLCATYWHYLLLVWLLLFALLLRT